MSVRFTSYKKEVLSAEERAVARALEICGWVAEGYAKEICPVKTGNLRNSITHEQINENTERIGSAVYYAPYVEFGHNQEPGRYVPAIGKRLVASHVAAKPYLIPAVENHRDEYEEIIKRELK